MYTEHRNSQLFRFHGRFFAYSSNVTHFCFLQPLA
jgi:hypothetical protein